MKYRIKKIKGSKYHYVDTNGNAFILRDGQLYHKMLAQQVNNSGYYRVAIAYSSGVTKYKLIHRLVAEAFIDNKHSYETVNHIDGNKTNNHVDNLEWLNREQNFQHAKKNGLFVGAPKLGIDYYVDEAAAIKEEYTGEWGQAKALSAKYGLSAAYVRQIVGPYDKNSVDQSPLAQSVRAAYRGRHGDIKRLSKQFNISTHKVKRYVGKY